MGFGEGVGGCQACIKYLLFAFNFLFWLMGCGLVGIGIWVLVDPNFKEFADKEGLELLKYAGIALLVIGGIIMFVGFFGCCGAIRESPCLLVTFFICLFVLFVVLVGAGVWILVSRDTFIQKATDLLKQGVADYKKDMKTTSPAWIFTNTVQGVLQCCGSENPLIEYLGVTLPSSCTDDMGAKITDLLKSAADGRGANLACKDKIIAWMQSNTIIMSGVSIGVGVIMLLGMVFSMLLCCAIKDTN